MSEEYTRGTVCTVNGKRDSGLMFRDIIGKKVTFIRKTRSGLMQVRVEETGKLKSIPKYNLDAWPKLAINGDI